MLWAIFVMLLTIGLVGLLGSSGLIANVIQIFLVGALVALGIQPGPQLAANGSGLVWTLVWTLVVRPRTVPTTCGQTCGEITLL